MPTFFRPETDYGKRLLTFRDAIDYLADYGHTDSGGEVERFARRAVLRAYDEMVKAHRWNFYVVPGRIITVASQVTGTIEYDHTGGTYERQVTLTDATWPSWAADGVIRIGNVAYHIQERKSDTVVTLLSTENPGTDVASGTAYTIYKDQYRMPSDFQEASELTIAENTIFLEYVAPSRIAQISPSRYGPNTPFNYTFVGDPGYYGAYSILFFPPPDAVYQIDFLYKRYARPLRIEDYSTGKATTTASSTTVTGTGTSWTSSMVGSVIRFSENTTTAPTGSGGINPAHSERIVVSVESATSLTVDAALSDSLSGVKYSISDLIDIDLNSMTTFFHRECEKQLRIIRRMDPTKSEDREYETARELAWAADSSRSFEKRSASPYYRHAYRLADMPSED